MQEKAAMTSAHPGSIPVLNRGIQTTLLMSMIMLIAIGSSRAQYIDCNACNYDCVDKVFSLDVSCPGKYASCRTASDIVSAYKDSVEVNCANDPVRLDKRDLIDAAITILDQSGIVSQNEFDGVEIRFCGVLETVTVGDLLFGLDGALADLGIRISIGLEVKLDSAAGFVANAGKLLLAPSTRDLQPKEMSRLLAHEIVHIKQYRNLGLGTFRCEYLQNLVQWGFGSSNPGNKHLLENPAYAAGKRAAQDLNTYESNLLSACWLGFAAPPCAQGLSIQQAINAADGCAKTPIPSFELETGVTAATACRAAANLQDCQAIVNTLNNPLVEKAFALGSQAGKCKALYDYLQKLV